MAHHGRFTWPASCSMTSTTTSVLADVLYRPTLLWDHLTSTRDHVKNHQLTYDQNKKCIYVRNSVKVMKFRIVLLLIATLAVLSNCKRRNREPTWNADAEKRSRYSEAFLDQYEPQHNKLKTDAFDKEIVSDYATENSPVFWKDIEQGDLGLKKEEEGLPPEGFQQAGDELPSTVGPNENIYGGFPINDVIGGFELPSPETLAVLKLALKQHGPRNEYEATLHHDLENWAYGYEHHALPEYDIKETPPFYVAILQGLKLMQENKSAPGCKEAKPGCGPMIPLTNDQCNTLAGNCMPSKPITSDGFEKPCPWKILEWIYGCKEPKRPTTSEKPDETEPPVPPPPKPDKPEKPVEAKPVNVKPEKTEEPKPTEKAPQKAQEEEKPSKKPKPIPIQFNTFHGEKLAPDIKDDMSSTRDSSSALVSGNSTLSEELGILANLSNKDSKAAAREKEKSTATSAGEGLANTNNTSESKLHVDSSQVPDIALEIDNEQTSLKSTQSELITKGKPEPAKEPAKEPPLQTGNNAHRRLLHKNELDLSLLPNPESIQLGSLRGHQLELVYPNKQKLFIKLPSAKDLSQKNGFQQSLRMKGHSRRKFRNKISQGGSNTHVKSSVHNSTRSKNIENENHPPGKVVRSGNGQQTILTTDEVSYPDISPVISSLGRELETRLNKKLRKIGNGDTAFTISVGISPEDTISRKADVSSAKISVCGVIGHIAVYRVVKDPCLAQEDVSIGNVMEESSTYYLAQCLNAQWERDYMTEKWDISSGYSRTKESTTLKWSWPYCTKQKLSVKYLSWSEWSACESKCGIGRSVRTRKCSGLKCSGMSSEQKACFRDPCESKVANSKQISSVSKLIQAMGAPWTEWSPCSAKFAGFGFQTRKRDCKKGNCNLNLNLVQSKACLRQNHSGLIAIEIVHSVVENLLNNTMPTNVQQACLYIHNSYRLPHGADELKWSDYLATAAKKLANNLARNSTTSEQVKQYELPGTSILVLPVGDSSNIGQEAACVASAKLWYGENKNYNFNQPHLTSNNRHFTQMIWKASKTLGLATAQPNPSGRLYFVAMYDPPGNQDTYVGFKKNALPLQLQRRNGVDYEDTPIVRRTRYKPQWP
eukprot:gene5411-6086_t